MMAFFFYEFQTCSLETKLARNIENSFLARSDDKLEEHEILSYFDLRSVTFLLNIDENSVD